MSIKSRIISGAMVLGLVGGTLAVAVPAGADLDAGLDGNQLVQCAGINTIATLNPTIKDGDAKYIKAANKASDGTKQQFLTNDPVPANALTCFVDAGIATDQAGQDPKYLLDDQSNGNTLLTMAGGGPFGFTPKITGVFRGSSSCYAEDPSPASKSYPNVYPLNGKLIWKFDQADAKLKQLQIQQYLRIGAIAGTASDLSVSGIVIKGPGIGGDVSASITFYPTNSTKNVDPIGCTDGVGLDSIPGNTDLKELWLYAIDGPDADSVVDPWSITIPS